MMQAWSTFKHDLSQPISQNDWPLILQIRTRTPETKLFLESDSLGSEDQHGTVPPVLPQGVQKGDGRPVQQGGAPIAVLLLGTDQLQHRVETAPHPEAEFLQRDSESSGPQPDPRSPAPTSQRAISQLQPRCRLTLEPSLPSFTSRFRNSSMRPGCVSTATVRNSRIMTLMRISSILLCSRVRKASRMAAASLPRQAYTDMGATWGRPGHTGRAPPPEKPQQAEELLGIAREGNVQMDRSGGKGHHTKLQQKVHHDSQRK